MVKIRWFKTTSIIYIVEFEKLEHLNTHQVSWIVNGSSPGIQHRALDFLEIQSDVLQNIHYCADIALIIYTLY